MKEASSLTVIFQIVIIFILLFTAIMALTINNSNAFAVKNSVVNIIEQSKGNIFDQGTDGKVLNEKVVEALKEASYYTTGDCNKNGDEGYVGYDRSGIQTTDKGKAAICIKEVNVSTALEKELIKRLGATGRDNVIQGTSLPAKYYEIKVFFHLDLPVISSAFDLTSKASTKIIYGA